MSILDSASSIAGDVTSLVGGNIARHGIQRLAGAAQRGGDPFEEAARQPYIAELSRMLFGGGAKDFLQSDPLIQAQKSSIGDWAKANFASSGNLPLTGITGSSQLASVFGNQLQQRIQDLMMAGGFTMSNPYGGQGYVAAMNPTMQTYNQQIGAAGNLVGQGMNLFGGGGGTSGGYNFGTNPF